MIVKHIRNHVDQVSVHGACSRAICRILSPVKIEAVTVADRSKACTIFVRSEVVIVGSNSTQNMDVLYVYVFILCLCCPVFR
jgi:hypothetical protein